MVKSFAKYLENKKQILMRSSILVQVDGLQMNFKLMLTNESKKGLSLSISPDIILSKSNKKAVDLIDGYKIQKELLEEDDLIRLIEEVRLAHQLSYLENSLPIDCLASSGTLIALLKKFCLPNISASVNHEEKRISPIVKPSRLDEVEHISGTFMDQKSYYCMYHTYDNYLRLLIYESSESVLLADSASHYSNSMIVEIHVEQTDFKQCFVQTNPEVRSSAGSVYNNWLREANLDEKESESRLQILIKDILELVQSQESIPNFQWRTSANIDALRNCSSSVVAGIQDSLVSLGYSRIQELVANIACFAKVMDSLQNILTFVIVDQPEHKRFVFYTRVECLDGKGGILASQTAPVEHEVAYTSIEQQFLVNIEAAEWDEKRMLLKHIIDGFSIEQPQQKDNNDSHYSYSLSLGEPSKPQRHTFTFKTQPGTSVEVAATLLALNKVPIGISITVEHSQLQPMPVCFLVVHPRKRL